MEWITWLLQVVLAGLLGLFYHHLKSYMDAKARNLASKEDFRTLREQTNKLTTDTEEIKAKISDRQNRWNLKVQSYTSLLEQLGEMQSTISRLERAEELRRRYTPASSPSAEAEQLLRRHEELGATISRAVHAAALVLPHESLAVLSEHIGQLGELAKNRPADDLEWIRQGGAALAISVDRFLSTARLDLGIDAPERAG